MDGRWTPESSHEEIQFVLNEEVRTFSSPLVEKLIEHIKRGGKDQHLDMELFDELYQLEDSKVKAIFKEVSKFLFRRPSTAPTARLAIVPKLSWQHTRVTSRGAQPYRPHYVHCSVRTKRAYPSLQGFPWGILETWLPLGLNRQVAIYLTNNSTWYLTTEQPKLDIFFSFTLFAQNLRFKHVGLMSFRGYKFSPTHYFIPFILDISNEVLEIPRTISSATATSSTGHLTTKKKGTSKQSNSIKPETGICKPKKIAFYLEHYPPLPPVWNAISTSESELSFHDELYLLGQWSRVFYRNRIHVARKWPAPLVPPRGPDDMPPDFLKTLQWHAQHQHRYLAPVVAATMPDAPFPILVFDAPLIDIRKFMKRHGTRHRHYAPPDVIYPTLIAIAMGLEYLHSTGKVHGRFQPLCVRIGTLGAIRIIDHDNFSDPSPPSELSWSEGTNDEPPIFVETDVYAAPELFTAKEYHPSMDCFSFGLVLWHIIYRERPRNKAEDIWKGIVPSTAHPSDSGLVLSPRAPADRYFEFLGLGELYQNCTHPDPEKRPPFGEVISCLSSLYSEWQAKPNDVKVISHPTYNPDPQ